MYPKYQLYILVIVFFCGCHNRESENLEGSLPARQNPPGKIGEADSIRKLIVKPSNVARGPVINITDTVLEKATFISTKDSAANLKILDQKLSQLHHILEKTILEYSLVEMSPPLAFYKTVKAPYFFEAAMQVNKSIALKTKKIYFKTLQTGPAIVAHFYGPRDLLNIGYASLKDYLANQKLKQSGSSLEIYFPPIIPGKNKKPSAYNIQTDIIIPLKN